MTFYIEISIISDRENETKINVLNQISVSLKRKEESMMYK